MLWPNYTLPKSESINRWLHQYTMVYEVIVRKYGNGRVVMIKTDLVCLPRYTMVSKMTSRIVCLTS